MTESLVGKVPTGCSETADDDLLNGGAEVDTCNGGSGANTLIACEN